MTILNNPKILKIMPAGGGSAFGGKHENILLKSALVLAIVDLILIAAILTQVQGLVKDVLEVQNRQMEVEGMKERLRKTEEVKEPEIKSEDKIVINKIVGLDLDLDKWNSYKNEDLGFQIQYPKEWIVSPYQWKDAHNSHFIGFRPKTASEVVWVVRVSNNDLKIEETRERRYIFEKGNLFYIITNGAIDNVDKNTFHDNSIYEYTFDEFYKSFKFLN